MCDLFVSVFKSQVPLVLICSATAIVNMYGDSVPVIAILLSQGQPFCLDVPHQHGWLRGQSKHWCFNAFCFCYNSVGAFKSSDLPVLYKSVPFRYLRSISLVTVVLHRVPTHHGKSWKNQKSWNTISLMDSHRKIREFKRLQAVWFYTVVLFF